MLLVAVLGDTVIDLRGTVYFTGLHQGQLTTITDDDVQVVASLRDAAVAALTDIGRRP